MLEEEKKKAEAWWCRSEGSWSPEGRFHLVPTTFQTTLQDETQDTKTVMVDGQVGTQTSGQLATPLPIHANSYLMLVPQRWTWELEVVIGPLCNYLTTLNTSPFSACNCYLFD